ncbi:MAG: carbonic anhydrase family protein [Thalassobaculaceae bacterium]|nr:carbonic anhydrase family protein [Thalassobaculaceae bacterium]
MTGMTRRKALHTTLFGALVWACCGVVAGPAAAADGPSWSYEGKTGPEGWGSLSKDYAVCAQGTAQSPVDLVSPIGADIEPVTIRWDAETDGQVLNNGHTIEVKVPNGSTVKVGTTTYDLLQFHFHHPSEHVVDGKPLAMEVHFVHQSAAGDLAVVGVLFEEGAENPALAPIWSAMPKEKGDGPVVAITPKAFLPAGNAQFRYAGSLTTPPCSEIVTWIAYETPVQASRAQIAAFAELFPMNARPVQPLHRRFLLIGGE